MEPQFLAIAAVAGAAMGFACGLIPKSAARSVGREGFGNGALAACMLAGAVLGCLGALPLALILTWIVKASGDPEAVGPAARRGPPGGRRRGPGERPAGPFTAIGPVIVCNRCQGATSKLKDGSVPAECPHCHREFKSVPTVQPTGRGRPARRIEAEDDLIPLQPAEGVNPVADPRPAN